MCPNASRILEYYEFDFERGVATDCEEVSNTSCLRSAEGGWNRQLIGLFLVHRQRRQKWQKSQTHHKSGLPRAVRCTLADVPPGGLTQCVEGDGF